MFKVENWCQLISIPIKVEKTGKSSIFLFYWFFFKIFKNFFKKS